MPSRQRALTGPPAAAVFDLDGFRGQTWPDLWCVPIGGVSSYRTVRIRDWRSPTLLGDVPVAPIETVLRHLNLIPDDLIGHPDGVAPIDRVELAVEHAARTGVGLRPRQGARTPGDAMLNTVLVRRRADVAPTESYAETRAVQLLRSWDITPWRQIAVARHGRVMFPR